MTVSIVKSAKLKRRIKKFIFLKKKEKKNVSFSRKKNYFYFLNKIMLLLKTLFFI